MRGWFVTFVLTESGRVEDAKFELFWCLIYAVRHGMGVNKLRNKKKNGEIEGETKEELLRYGWMMSCVRPPFIAVSGRDGAKNSYGQGPMTKKKNSVEVK
jgi:hypothetical protein